VKKYGKGKERGVEENGLIKKWKVVCWHFMDVE